MKKLKLSNVTENTWTELSRLGRTLQNKILLEIWIRVYSYKYLEEIDAQKVWGSNELGLFKDLKEGPGEKKNDWESWGVEVQEAGKVKSLKTQVLKAIIRRKDSILTAFRSCWRVLSRREWYVLIHGLTSKS